MSAVFLWRTGQFAGPGGVVGRQFRVLLQQAGVHFSRVSNYLSWLPAQNCKIRMLPTDETVCGNNTPFANLGAG
jgi:hypothetical protein